MVEEDVSRRVLVAARSALLQTHHDRSSLHLERAYFTQFSPCCDNSDDVLGILVFDELVKKFELKVRACG